jgi:hypothetical protein
MPFQVREESLGGFGNGSCTSRAAALSSNVRAAWSAQLMSQRLAAVRLITCTMMDAAQECRSDSYGRSLAATLNCLAGDWIDRTAFAACWFDTSITENRLASAGG